MSKIKRVKRNIDILCNLQTLIVKATNGKTSYSKCYTWFEVSNRLKKVDSHTLAEEYITEVLEGYNDVFGSKDVFIACDIKDLDMGVTRYYVT